MDMIFKVRDFLTKAGADIKNKPTLNEEQSELMVSLIFEELSELSEALGEDAYSRFLQLCKKELENQRTVKGKGKLVNILKEAIDLEYVLYNVVNFFGLHNIWSKAEELVHNSNMSKFHSSWDEAKVTIELAKVGVYPGREGQSMELIATKIGDAIVVKNKDGKVMKNVNYQKVKIEDLQNLIENEK